MFTPKINKNDNPEEIRAFVEANGFGLIVSQTENNKLWATHLPLMWETNKNGDDVLRGHLARANPQWKNFEQNQEVMVVFSGAHTYISSSWYDHENVPTWNYIAVHIYGTIRTIEGEELLNSLKTLVDKYEKYSKKPVSVEGMSQQYVATEMKGIVGFEIEITDVQATYKLSQNRDAKNHAAVISELEERGDAHSVEIAKEMKKHGQK